MSPLRTFNMTVVCNCMKTQLPYFKSGYLWGLTKNPVSLLDQAEVNLVGLCLRSHSCLIPCPFLSDFPLSSQFPFTSYLLMNPHLRVCFWAFDLRHASWLQSFIAYALPTHLPRAWSFRKLHINNSTPNQHNLKLKSGFSLTPRGPYRFWVNSLWYGGGKLEGGRSRASSRKTEILIPTLSVGRVGSELLLGADAAPCIAFCDSSPSIWQTWNQTRLQWIHWA